MDKGSQSLLLTGKYGVSDGNFSPVATFDQEAYISREMISQTRSYEKSVLSTLNYPYGSSYEILDRNIQSSKEYNNRCRCVEREQNLKRQKTEPSLESFNLNPTVLFNHLPELRSMEQMNHVEMHLRQKFPPLPTVASQHLLEWTLTNYSTPAPPQPLRPPVPPPVKFSGKDLAYQRRHTISQKTRLLQKLLPVDKKMNMATIYEETYKYIKFLKAQIAVLESMPVLSSSSWNFRSENPRYGGLGKLNRQQLLEVLVNSPKAQSTMYSSGCCIYSVEQLMFNDVVEKRFFVSDR